MKCENYTAIIIIDNRHNVVNNKMRKKVFLPTKVRKSMQIWIKTEWIGVEGECAD